MPLIEAVQFNLHQLVRDLPVFREITGDLAIFFQAETAEELANTVEKYMLIEFKDKSFASNVRPVKWRDSAKQLSTIIFSNAFLPIDHTSS